MPMSEHEQKVLDELEADLIGRPEGPTRVPRLDVASTVRVGVSAVAVAIAVLVVVLGTVLNNAVGIVLALVGFILAVGLVAANFGLIAHTLSPRIRSILPS